MRTLAKMLLLAFALGSPLAFAGEGCGHGSNATTKGDFETPPPSASSDSAPSKS